MLSRTLSPQPIYDHFTPGLPLWLIRVRRNEGFVLVKVAQHVVFTEEGIILSDGEDLCVELRRRGFPERGQGYFISLEHGMPDADLLSTSLRSRGGMLRSDTDLTRSATTTGSYEQGTPRRSAWQRVLRTRHGLHGSIN